ncbi:hypothetical protein, partial [Haemophilus sp. SZY H54]
KHTPTKLLTLHFGSLQPPNKLIILCTGDMQTLPNIPLLALCYSYTGDKHFSPFPYSFQKSFPIDVWGNLELKKEREREK